MPRSGHFLSYCCLAKYDSIFFCNIVGISASDLPCISLPNSVSILVKAGSFRINHINLSRHLLAAQFGRWALSKNINGVKWDIISNFPYINSPGFGDGCMGIIPVSFPFASLIGGVTDVIQCKAEINGYFCLILACPSIKGTFSKVTQPY